MQLRLSRKFVYGKNLLNYADKEICINLNKLNNIYFLIYLSSNSFRIASMNV